MDAFFDWIRGPHVILWWLFSLSVLMVLASVVAVPWLVVHIPSDYFNKRRHLVDRWRSSRPRLRYALLAGKNVFGCVLVLAGIAMLVLPGQGILTVFAGLMLLDFPGKLALQRWLARKRAVNRTINWMRSRAGRPPLDVPGADDNPLTPDP